MQDPRYTLWQQAAYRLAIKALNEVQTAIERVTVVDDFTMLQIIIRALTVGFLLKNSHSALCRIEPTD